MNKILNNTWTMKNLAYLHIELSNYCNAACPICPRFLGTTPCVDPSIKLEQITIEKFKQYFPIPIIQQITRYIFCGSHGDPMTAKDIIPILKYIYTYNKAAHIEINTNGSLGTIDDWKTIGNLLSDKSHTVKFSIDGLNDTNHLYRRNVNFNKVIDNAKTFINAGGSAWWEFLVFKHNEHQILKAEQLSKIYKFNRFYHKRAFGFPLDQSGNIISIPVYDSNGDLEYLLEPPTDSTHINVNQVPDMKQSQEFLQHIDVSVFADTKLSVTNEDVDSQYNKLNNLPIRCKFLNGCKSNNTELYVNANGIVLPCCFIGSAYNGTYSQYPEVQVQQTFRPHINELSLKTNTLIDIVSSEIFTRVVVNAWKKNKYSDGKLLYCSIMCNDNSKLTKLYVNDPNRSRKNN